MIRFEFVQPGEFDDPFYEVFYEDLKIAELRYSFEIWLAHGVDYLTQDDLEYIYWKLNELNKATKSPRILGVF